MLRFRRQLHHAPHPRRQAGRARAHGRALRRAAGSWLGLGGLYCTFGWLDHGSGGKGQLLNCRASRERASTRQAFTRACARAAPSDASCACCRPREPPGWRRDRSCSRCAGARRLAGSWRGVGRTDMALRKGGASDASERMGVRRRSWKRILACGRGHSIWTGAVGGRVHGTLT
jgi:hypothetical protein